MTDGTAHVADGTAHVTDGTAHVTDGTAHALHLHTLDLRLQPATSVRLHSRHLRHIYSMPNCHVNMQEGSCKEYPAYLTTLATCIACCALLPTWLSQQMENLQMLWAGPIPLALLLCPPPPPPSPSLFFPSPHGPFHVLTPSICDDR